jgi:hypothetical protein
VREGEDKRVRRLAFVALVVAAACGQTTKLPPGPSDTFYKPIGIGVYGGKLLVASSNADLRYDDPTGGTVIAVDPSADPAPLAGTINTRSFAGQLVVADPAVCPILNAAAGAITVVPVRGDDVVYRLRTRADGALACDGCETALSSTGWADAFTAGLACGPGIARAYVGYLRSSIGQAVFSQLDLTKDPSEPGFLQTAAVGLGVVQAYAYDAPRKRLYFTRSATAAAGALLWVELGGGCNFDPSRTGACFTDQANAPNGIELRGIVLSSSEAAPRRAYLTARIFDSAAAASSGVRVGDFDGLLIVADLVENLAGRTELHIVKELPIGYGAAEIVRLPARPGKRDVVAALAADDAVLWIYDDETGEAVQIGRDLVGAAPTGAPLVGHQPFGVAADPVAGAGNVARVYVASYEENFVTPIDVPLDDIRGACPVVKAGGTTADGTLTCAATPADVRRIGGGTR